MSSYWECYLQRDIANPLNVIYNLATVHRSKIYFFIINSSCNMEYNFNNFSYSIVYNFSHKSIITL